MVACFFAESIYNVVTKTPAKTTFVDVSANAYYYDAVNWAVSKGITVGTDATHFSPNMGTTRAQVVTFLYRYMK